MNRKPKVEQRFLPGMSPGLVRVAKAAQRNPDRLLSLAHHIDVEALRRAYHRIRAGAAVGVDGVSKEEYGKDLETNLQDLHQRLKSMKYKHQPIRRVHIDKEGGKTRPIGISTVEDKIVQDSLRELLEAIYEQDFRDCSYGFRPGRSAHDALRALNGAVYRREVNVVLEADIVSFFDRIDRRNLKQLLEQRLADKSLLRLIVSFRQACLAGILARGRLMARQEAPCRRTHEPTRTQKASTTRDPSSSPPRQTLAQHAGQTLPDARSVVARGHATGRCPRRERREPACQRRLRVASKAG
jgi:hypothetical protein